MMSVNQDDSKAPKLVDDLPENSPSTLEHLCIECISSNHQILFYDDQDDTNPQGLQFHESVFIPVVLTDELFEHMLLHSSLSPERLINAFSNSASCCLQRCRIGNVTLSFECIETLCNSQNIQVLELFNVKFPDSDINLKHVLSLCNEKVVSFQLRDVQTGLYPYQVQFQCLKKDSHSSLRSIKLCEGDYAWYFLVDSIAPAPLLSLELSGYNALSEPDDVLKDTRKAAATYEPGGGGDRTKFFDHFRVAGNRSSIRATRKLVEDLENMYDNENEELPCSLLLLRYRLISLKHTLMSLTLFDTSFGSYDFDTILQLKKLQHLDIGKSSPDNIVAVERPDAITVYRIIESLPELVSLDVSSTYIGDDLYVKGKLKSLTGERTLLQPIPRRLDFLGLSETEGCELKDIYSLAHEVSGYHNEHQIITALQRYRNRPGLLTIAYNHLYTMNRHFSLSCPHKILKLILDALWRHPENNNLSLTCTANLFFVTRQHIRHYSQRQRNEVVLCIAKCINSRQSNKLIVRNLLLTLYHFEIPGDFIFQFGLITRTILSTLVLHYDHSEVNELVINLCNSLVCSMKYDMKSEVSKYNFVPTVVSIIRKRLAQNLCDELMQVAWSTLWNVSDETPANSEEFIDVGGLTLLQECFKNFPTELELQKNMMGLVGNIAEVRHLRKQLMSPVILDLLWKLLKEESQHIEVAYNVCGTLSHLLSDGPCAWSCEEYPRDVVKSVMFKVIESWNLGASRNINYRSFCPILGLIDCDVPECIHWAVWALCNLSSIDEKYCELLCVENGIEIVGRVENKIVHEKTKTLARLVVERVKEYQLARKNEQSILS